MAIIPCEKCGEATTNGFCHNCGFATSNENSNQEDPYRYFDDDISNPAVAFMWWKKETIMGRLLKPCNIISAVLIILLLLTSILPALVQMLFFFINLNRDIILIVAIVSTVISGLISLLNIPILIFNELNLVISARGFCARNRLDLQGGEKQQSGFMVIACRLAKDKKNLVLHCLLFPITLLSEVFVMGSLAAWPLVVFFHGMTYKVPQSGFLMFIFFVFICLVILIICIGVASLIGAFFMTIEKKATK